MTSWQTSSRDLSISMQDYITLCCISACSVLFEKERNGGRNGRRFIGAKDDFSKLVKSVIISHFTFRSRRMMSDDVAKAVEQEDILEHIDLFDMSRAAREADPEIPQNVPEILNPNT